MFHKAKAVVEDHLKAFGVSAFPPFTEVPGKGVFFHPGEYGPVIAVGKETVIDDVPLAEWLVIAGNALLHQGGSDITPLHLGPESEADEDNMRTADDLFYIVDLAAIYQCYLTNPVEVYCIYDEAIELGDEASLHPLAVALGLPHPRGLESMGFEPKKHQDVFEEADFFKPVITQKRPDLSLLIALGNAWQKHKGTAIKITLEQGVLRFSKTAG
jgi:hypothetical protein